MPSYKFTYFNGKGRAEVSRLLFAAAGKAFDDVRIDSAQWSDLKKVMPQGTLPVLEVGGKTKISQSAKKREEFLADYKLLDANRKKVEQLPKIKEYLKKRPVTTF
ncbi:SCRY3-like protein [Mya arenaria]|uniref:glutathione transferase n=1 Tax=Mya arenaria TaxID=6604 RepID=A0ABY7FW11_MYAAR|nr:SCRY3-like protein [Mya arenaria]